MLRRGLFAAILAVVLLGWTQGALAHTHPAPAPLASAPVAAVPVPYEPNAVLDTFLVAAAPAPDLTLVWVLGVLVAALALASRRSPRRAAVLALAVLLALLAFETGFHSVHHLSDPGARCVIASASSNLAGVAASSVDVVTSILIETGTTPAAEPVALSAPAFRPDEGRAPPA